MALKQALLLVVFSASMSHAAPAFTVDREGKVSLSNTMTIAQDGKSVEISTSGISSLGEMTFSSNVVINGDLTVRDTKAKAIYVPRGGLFMEGVDGGATPAGQIVSKQIKTSTLTFVGSAMLWEDANGVVKATMTATQLTIDGINSAKIQNKNFGSSAPLPSACDSESEFGLQYISRSPSRLYICADDGSGGYEWRYTNISP